jgi:alpha-tubulin suppressor-like RCC1 family protein
LHKPTFTIVGGGKAASRSSCAICKDGALWVSGNSNNGQLGRGNTASINEWTRITADGLDGHADKIVANSAFHNSLGTASAYAVTDDWKLFVAGYNAHGQLGIKRTTDIHTWTKITAEGVAGFVSDVFVSEIASSTSASLVTNDGNIWVSGRNDYGQLVTNSTTDIKSWTKISTISGRIVSVITNGYDGTQNGSAVTDSGDLWVTGCNQNYVFGTGSNLQIHKWTRIETEGLRGEVRK